jgi:putative acetyltransferase
MQISEASSTDTKSVLLVENEAFGEPSVADLVSELIGDPTARPVLSLLAREGDDAVGHIMFTSARLDGAPTVSASILAPLAVVPGFQRRGVGARLIEVSVERLAASGVELLFVLGHPEYYPRHGFVPAIPLGLLAPYPIHPEEAWMVRALRPGLLGEVQGTVRCADAMNRPEHWRE